jgi:Fe2+ or Zn2+ uptake regulation protein
LDLFRLQQCIEERNVNHSQSREVVFRILLEAHSCLSVSEVFGLAEEVSHKSISINTIYRHLNFFVECGLAVAIYNQNKKAYYALLERGHTVFTVCPQCGLIEKEEGDNNRVHEVLKEVYEEVEYIILHKVCKACI